MSNEVTRRESIPALAMNESELVTVLQNSLYPGAALTSIKMVIGYCRAQQLDPMQKPVHIVPMWDSKSASMRDVVMPGINLYRTQAARSGALAGVSEPEFGPDASESIGGVQMTYPAWCRVVVKRRLPTGEIVEFAAVERWRENYAVKGGKEKSIAPNAMWQRRPYGQLAKCAQAQALRIAFPEFGGAYTAEEMEGRALDDSATIEGSVREVPAQPTKPQALPPYSDDAFKNNYPAWRNLIEAGKKTPQELLAMLSTRASFSDMQKARILSIRTQTSDEQPQSGQDDDFIAQMDAADQEGVSE